MRQLAARQLTSRHGAQSEDGLTSGLTRESVGIEWDRSLEFKPLTALPVPRHTAPGPQLPVLLHSALCTALLSQ